VSRFVIDASAATEYLLRTPLGIKVEAAIEQASLIAPELLDVEVLSVLLAWQLRSNVSAYDALYVAAARLSNAPLLTADGPLARAPRLGIVVENVRLL
jgi:predicted nucleic acid-binding protein